jgi:hypothetical protein
VTKTKYRVFCPDRGFEEDAALVVEAYNPKSAAEQYLRERDNERVDPTSEVLGAPPEVIVIADDGVRLTYSVQTEVKRMYFAQKVF